VEDQRLQLAVTRLLTAISEQDFRRCREGYRPHLGALDAVDTLTIKRPLGRYPWVVEADMQGFFDPIGQEGMSRMVAERSDDRALLRWIKKWRQAGGLDTDGKGRHPVTGTPPGGIVSPSLANVYRHDAVDLWVDRVVTHHGRGEACRIRYAADCVWALEETARGRTLRHDARPATGDVRAGAIGREDAGHALQPATPSTEDQRCMAGIRVSRGQGPGRARPGHTPNRTPEATKLPEAVHPMVSGAPPSAAGGPVGAAQCHAPRV
jgi:hypothetical protein